MILGTTPTFTLKFKANQSINLNEVDQIYVTIKQGNNIITKTGEGVVVTGNKTLQFSLTETESLSFAPDKKIEIQVNWIYSYNLSTNIKRGATRVIEVDIEKQLLKQALIDV